MSGLAKAHYHRLPPSLAGRRACEAICRAPPTGIQRGAFGTMPTCMPKGLNTLFSV